MEGSLRIQSFENLVVWQHAQDLAVMVYEKTKSFPKEEIYGITNQVRRSAASVSANIAEGFGRKSPKDKLHFFVIAYGSLLETKNFLYLSGRLKFISEDDPDELMKETTSCQKLLNAYMRPLRV